MRRSAGAVARQRRHLGQGPLEQVEPRQRLEPGPRERGPFTGAERARDRRGVAGRGDLVEQRPQRVAARRQRARHVGELRRGVVGGPRRHPQRPPSGAQDHPAGGVCGGAPRPGGRLLARWFDAGHGAMTVASDLVAVLFATHARVPRSRRRAAAIRSDRRGSTRSSHGASQPDVADALVPLEPRAATLAELERVHPAAYLDAIERFCRAGGGHIDPDTAAGPNSWEAARSPPAPGSSRSRRCDRGRGRRGVLRGAPARPPRHRDTRRWASASSTTSPSTAAHLAARGERVRHRRLRRPPRQRHPGVFYDDPRVLYVSLPRVAAVPGHRRARRDRRGAGASARRSTCRCRPAPPATSTSSAFDDVVGPVVERFAPTWLLVSAGFDAHRRDPITDLGLSAGDFAR